MTLFEVDVSYVFTISVWSHHEIRVAKTVLSQKEVLLLWKKAAEDLSHPWLDLGEDETVDTVEESSDRRLYLTESAAYGAAKRLRTKIMGQERRVARAEMSRKKE